MLKRTPKILLSLLLIVSLVAGIFIPNALPSIAESNLDLVTLRVDEAPGVMFEYDPMYVSYTATVYESVSDVHITAIPNDPEARINIPGVVQNFNPFDTSPENNYGKIKVHLTGAKTSIDIDVVKGQQTKTYDIYVIKKETDARKRTVYPFDQVTTTTNQSQSGHLIDRKNATAWKPAAKTNEDMKKETIVLKLKEPGYVSRLDFLFQDFDLVSQEKLEDPSNKQVKVEISKDKETWTTILERADFIARRPEIPNDPPLNFARYELGDYFEAGYLRISFPRYQGLQVIPSIAEIKVYALDDDYAPSTGEIGEVYLPSSESLSRGSEILLERGLEYSGGIPGQDTGRGAINSPEKFELGIFSVRLENFGQNNYHLFKYEPNIKWSIMKSMKDPSSMNPQMEAYLPNLYSVYLEDIGALNAENNASAKTALDQLKETYPQAMAAAKINWTEENSANKGQLLKDFVQTAQPDAIVSDSLLFPHFQQLREGETMTMSRYASWQREAALLGHDGTATKPIPFGQFLNSTNWNTTSSQKRVYNGLALAMGMKFMDIGTIDFTSRSNLFDYDGHQRFDFLDWRSILRIPEGYVKAYRDHLTALNSDMVVTKLGTRPDGSLNQTFFILPHPWWVASQTLKQLHRRMQTTISRTLLRRT